MTALQPALDLRNSDGTRMNFRKPLLGMDAAKGAMGLGEDEVLAEIAAGGLRWSFDLRCRGEKMFLRVSTRAVAAWSDPTIRLPETLGEFADHILPPASKILGVLTIEQLCHIGFGTSGHLHNLIDEGRLESVGVAGLRQSLHGRRGPGGSPNVTRASVIALLKERQL